MNQQSVIPGTDAGPVSSGRLNRFMIGLMLLGLILCLAAAVDVDNRLRLSFGWLWGFLFLWMIMLGSLFFLGLHHLIGAIWSVVFKRIADMFAAPVWLLALLFLPVLFFVLWPGQFHVFPWADAALVEHDHVLLGKQAYLNAPFFALRAGVFFLLWFGFSRFYVGRSLAQDRGEGGVESSAKMRRVSAPFMLAFAVSITLAAVDWLMSLAPHWFSTIFGVYVFGGMVTSGLSAIIIVALVLRKSGHLPPALVTKDHLYSLGALLFAFTCFWGYIAFSQYMLIWYANLPEETFYLAHRLEGGWLAVSLTLTFTRFVLPFLALLSRHAKTNPRVLLWVSGLILTSQLVDLYWLIMPELHTAGPQLSWQELGPPILMVALLVLYCTRFLKRHSPLAVGDPLLDDSRKFHL
jgi:hypothetical protein